MLVAKTNKMQKRKTYINWILMINIDEKILDKILVGRIQNHIKKTIHYNEFGIIPVIQRQFNKHKSIHVIHHRNELKNKSHGHFSGCRKDL